MGRLQRVGDLEIDQDLGHARNAWRFQRIGWAAMLLTVLLALAGAFGDGPLSSAEAESAGLRLRYDRLARYDAVTTVELEVQRTEFTGNEARIWIDQGYATSNDIERVAPEPERMATNADTLWLVFDAGNATGPARITLDLRPRAMGLRTGRLGTGSGTGLDLRQFIYP